MVAGANEEGTAMHITIGLSSLMNDADNHFDEPPAFVRRQTDAPPRSRLI